MDLSLTKSLKAVIYKGRKFLEYSQAGKAPDSDSGERRFESYYSSQCSKSVDHIYGFFILKILCHSQAGKAQLARPARRGLLRLPSLGVSLLFQPNLKSVEQICGFFL